jgi:hypothetical protein
MRKERDKQLYSQGYYNECATVVEFEIVGECNE